MIKMEQSSQEVDSSTRSAGWRSPAAPGVESRNECYSSSATPPSSFSSCSPQASPPQAENSLPGWLDLHS